jgi:hypothetical protein
MTTTCPTASPLNGWPVDGFPIAVAALGFRPRRGSQPERLPVHLYAVRGQRRGTSSPGEDHNCVYNHAKTLGGEAAPGMRPGDNQITWTELFAIGSARDFGPGEDHNTPPPGGGDARVQAALGLRPRRGSQRQHRPGDPVHLHRQRQDLVPGEDHNQTPLEQITWTDLQRREFGPGEDPNIWARHPRIARRWAAPGLRPGEDHNLLDVHSNGTDGTVQRADFGPRRGSQRPDRQRERHARDGQRRVFGPGEDHNTRATTILGATEGKQRRVFGPGEDHNYLKVVLPLKVKLAAPGLRPRRGHNRPPG